MSIENITAVVDENPVNVARVSAELLKVARMNTHGDLHGLVDADLCVDINQLTGITIEKHNADGEALSPLSYGLSSRIWVPRFSFSSLSLSVRYCNAVAGY